MTLPTDLVRPAVPAASRGDLRELAWLAAPVVLSQLSTTLMGIVDSAIVGRLGATQLAAVGFSGVWTWTVFSLLFGTVSAVQTFVSQDDGAGRRATSGRWAWIATLGVAPVAVLAAVAAAQGVPHALAALAPSQGIQETAVAYLRPRFGGLPGLVIAFAWMSFFRGIGDTRTPLWVAIAANLLNGALDYGLVYGELGLPRLGVAGAGVATCCGEWLQGLALLGLALRRPLRRRWGTRFALPAAGDLLRLLRVGVPIGGQWLIDMLAFAAFTTLVARMGDASMAASQAFVMLLSLSFMQAVGISVAASTLVGRYVGAGDPDAAERSFRSALWLAAGLAAGVGTLFLLAPEPLLRVFTDEPEVLALGIPLLRIGAGYQWLDAVVIVTSGALRGAGDTRWPFAVQASLAWGLFVPLAWWLGVGQQGGVVRAWLGGFAYIGVLAGVMLWRFRAGAWRRIAI